MHVHIAIPDDVAFQLRTKWGDLERRALEAVAIEAYRDGAISAGKVGELLELPTRLETDTFLKARGVALLYDEADFAQDLETMRRFSADRT